MVGQSPEMEKLYRILSKVAFSTHPVLILGESGTGKELVARSIHFNGPNAAKPFVPVDCGSLVPTLIESELFGHVKGAFTGADRERLGKFAAAGRGTLLLDEINSLPLSLQSKLLRVVEDRVFEPVGSNRGQLLHARIIAVSNALLEQEIKDGRFRSDLYFRLNVVGFYLPNLRSRCSSIIPLCHKFLGEFTATNRPDVDGIAMEALRALQEYDWPGNVRELRNVIERAVALCPGPIIQLGDLPETIRSRIAPAQCTLAIAPREIPGRFACMTLAESKEVAEIQRIKEVLAKHKNNRLRAAGELGISRMGLYKKLHKYGLAQRRRPEPQKEIA